MTGTFAIDDDARGRAARPAWPDLEAAVRAWIADDPDPTTADELRRLLALAEDGPQDEGNDSEVRLRRDARGGARNELADRFSGMLQFGTAGLRGRLGGGPNRMNRAVVIRAAAGLADYLLGELDGVTPPPRVVVGYDARHRSDDFALDTAAVLTAVGIETLLLPEPLPTPVLAFALRYLGADAGVQVTASHNPASDNGYKVYLGGRIVTDAGRGSQIVPPYDAAIAAEIARVPSVASVPRATRGWTVLGQEIVDAYVQATLTVPERAAGLRVDPVEASRMRIVLTPLHGVGGDVAARVLEDAGFTNLLVVPEQADPDPDFPSIAFPNPEEPGVVDLALDLAWHRHADLVLALDPDADRCAVAVQDPRSRSRYGLDSPMADGWRMLHGDEVGALLGSVIAEHRRARSDGAVLASSIVSSRLLEQIAQDAGLRYAPTLTGFKWLSRVDGLAFGYEEALGYCVDPQHVRDKDGISAALLVATLAAHLRGQGRRFVDALDDLARRFGVHLQGQVSTRFADAGDIAARVAELREHPPATLGGAPVDGVVDLAHGSDEDRRGLPPTDGVALTTTVGTRVVVRPSGTEPKVKCYLEVVEPVAPTADEHAVGAARRAAAQRMRAVETDLRAALRL
jgi:phosphomannomutase